MCDSPDRMYEKANEDEKWYTETAEFGPPFSLTTKLGIKSVVMYECMYKFLRDVNKL